MVELRRVTVLVDWDTARRVEPKIGNELRRLDAVFSKLRIAIASYISSKDTKNVYRVSWRMYHGWHQGKTKTEDRRYFDSFALSVRSQNIRSVSFSSDFGYSEMPCCPSSRTPIFDTLRREHDSRVLHQKMVDTILICDLLHLIRCRDSYLYILIANDDDFVPALFMAEAWKAKVVMLHNRDSTNPHLMLKGISERMKLS
jgi:hypothetical protein